MNYRRLGQAGIKLSEIGLGSWLTYGYGVKDDTARQCVRRALDLGINFFDTADAYHRGAAEEFLGRELHDVRRRDLALATKCFFPISENVNDQGLSRKHIWESVHASLRHLQTDYIDLYQCHRFDPEVEVAEVVRTMDDLIRQGKILYWGVSEWTAEQIRAAQQCAAALHAYPPMSNQPEYSIAARRVETNGVQRTCVACGMGMVVWSPLKQGVLTGKYSGGKIPRDSRAASREMNAFLNEIDRGLADRVDRLRPIAERRGLTLAQLAIKWPLTREGVTSVIIGASRPAQVEENCDLPDVELSPEDLAQIDALFPAAENP
jgi:aryl-alcohol dehydrogenase-like predicted oxidoreductase